MTTPATTSTWSSEAISALPDREVVARTAWGEARGLGHDGMQATVNTLQNRLASGVHWWGNSLRTLCLKRYQYSCWLDGDPNLPKLLAVTEADKEYQIALGLADRAIDGTLADITNGADSYFDDRMPSMPLWAFGRVPVFVLGTQRYFKTT